MKDCASVNIDIIKPANALRQPVIHYLLWLVLRVIGLGDSLNIKIVAENKTISIVERLTKSGLPSFISCPIHLPFAHNTDITIHFCVLFIFIIFNINLFHFYPCLFSSSFSFFGLR